jgi:hypothetical protein
MASVENGQIDFLGPDPISFPSLGMLRWADRLVVPGAVLVFACNAAAAVWQAAGSGATGFVAGWLVGVFVTLVLWMNTAWQLPRRQKDVTHLHRRRALLAAVLGTFCTIGMVIFAATQTQSAATALYLWPLFPLGQIGLVLSLRRSQISQMGPAWSRLSRWVVAYALSASIVLAFAIANELGQVFAQFWPLRSIGAAGAAGIQVGVLLVPATSAAAGGIALYYTMRRADLDRQIAVVVHDIVQRIAQFDDPLQHLQEIAELICSLLPISRIAFLRPDPTYYERIARRVPGPRSPGYIPVGCEFVVAGAAGPGSEQVRGLRFPMDKGIAHSVVIHGTAKIIDDVDLEKWDDGYVDLGLNHHGCELSIPIYDLDRPDIVLAIIVAQDARKGVYRIREQVLLERIGEPLAMYALRNPSAYQQMYDEIERLAHLNGFDEMVTQILDSSRRLFQTPWVAFLPLGVGTRVPLLQRTYTHQDVFQDVGFLSSDMLREEVSGIPHLIRTWNPLFLYLPELEVMHDPISAFWRTWTDVHNIRALALIPVGNQDRGVGVLLIGFSELGFGFRPGLQLLLSGFGLAISPHLGMAHHRESLYEGFLQPPLSYHRILNEEQCTNPRLLLDGLDKASPMELRRRVGQLVPAITRLIEEAGTQLPDFRTTTLEAALWEFRRALHAGGRYKPDIQWRLLPKTDGETRDLNTMLYRLITEAILNAASHGHAKAIYIQVARLRNSVQVTVADNGEGFAPAHISGKPHPGGVRDLMERLTRQSGAMDLTWGWTQPGLGSVFQFCIPVLPDNGQPVKPSISDWYDDMLQWPPWADASYTEAATESL